MISGYIYSCRQYPFKHPIMLAWIEVVWNEFSIDLNEVGASHTKSTVSIKEHYPMCIEQFYVPPNQWLSTLC